MDRVRFGRALGYGARHAARTLAQAVDAATAPSATPATSAATAKTSTPAPAARSGDDLRQSVVQAQATVQRAGSQVQRAQSQVRSAARAADKSALAPVARFSSVLWLEVTGSFFALVAFVLGQALWKRRGMLHVPGEGQKVFVLAAMFLLFAYFAVSSFVRARRRQRR